eukprot:11177465-Lingulodinium_polyedra.AAC.1
MRICFLSGRQIQVVNGQWSAGWPIQPPLNRPTRPDNAPFDAARGFEGEGPSGDSGSSSANDEDGARP